MRNIEDNTYGNDYTYWGAVVQPLHTHYISTHHLLGFPPLPTDKIFDSPKGNQFKCAFWQDSSVIFRESWQKEREKKCIKGDGTGSDVKPISIIKTRMGISFFQSHVQDENENFFLSISWFETRTGISFSNLRLRDENENQD